MNELFVAGQTAAAEIGIEWQVVPQNGQWHETPVFGKDRRNGAGRIKLFPDGEGGLVTNWITGETLTFWARSDSCLDQVEHETRRKRSEELRLQAEADRQQMAKKAADKTVQLGKAAGGAEGNPYLVRKGVQSVASLRQIDSEAAAVILGYTPKGLTGSLLVVPVKVSNRWSSTQLISADGQKHFLAGGILRGGFWATGKLPEEDSNALTFLIVEGVATALSCYSATDFLTVAAMSCGNLRYVTADLRKRYPTARLIVCGDKGNGEDDARRAAMESGTLLIVPEIIGDGSDFNDVHIFGGGLDEVCRQIERATQPIPEPPLIKEDPVEGTTSRRSPYQFAMSTSELRNLDVQIEYVVEGLIPKGFITLFYAPSGLGKSTLANQLCQAVQDGTSFLGLSTVKTPVFYLDYENPLPTIIERLRKIGGTESFPLWHHGCETPPPQIDNHKERDVFLEIEPGTLLVIDTLKACNDVDENKATDMKPLFDFIKNLRRHGLTIIILHHTTKGPDGTYRGSSVIQDQADHCISLVKVKTPGSDQETSDDHDVATYRFGVKGKTRAKPFQIFLTFDREQKLFIAAKDPQKEVLRRVGEAIDQIAQRGIEAKQNIIVAEIKSRGGDVISNHKIYAALKEGSDHLWAEKRGLHNAKIFTLLPDYSGFSVLHPLKGVQNRKTEACCFSGEILTIPTKN